MDRRIKRTKKLLKKELVKLLKTNPLSKITVTELCDKADINRSTFYIHYRDIFDIYDEINEELYSYFNSAIEKHFDVIINLVDTLNPASNKMSIELFKKIFEFIKENKDLSEIMINETHKNSLISRLLNSGKKNSLAMLKKHLKSYDEDTIDYFYEFISSGCVGIYKNWIKTDMKDSPEKMAIMVADFISYGTKYFVIEENIK